MATARDVYGRPLGTLRLSVTDRCNLRCRYCMPEDRYVWLPRDHLLDFDELSRLADVFFEVGVRRVRLTGGEPLLRRELPTLVRQLARKPAIEDLALTTNGTLLAGQAAALRDAGLGRLTVSLDTLRAERFAALTRHDSLDQVLAGIAAAQQCGFDELKIDAVVVRGVNEDELVALLRHGQSAGAEVRFIEYMNVPGATHWRPERVVNRDEILATIVDRLGKAEPVAGRPAAPARRYRLADGTVFGIVAADTAPFCEACDRSRLTADGLWYRCLHATVGTDLKTPLRTGASPEQLRKLVTKGWQQRADRGAEGHDPEQSAGPPGPKDPDPHCQMHTRGG